MVFYIVTTAACPVFDYIVKHELKLPLMYIDSYKAHSKVSCAKPFYICGLSKQTTLPCDVDKFVAFQRLSGDEMTHSADESCRSSSGQESVTAKAAATRGKGLAQNGDSADSTSQLQSHIGKRRFFAKPTIALFTNDKHVAHGSLMAYEKIFIDVDSLHRDMLLCVVVLLKKGLDPKMDLSGKLRYEAHDAQSKNVCAGSVFGQRRDVHKMTFHGMPVLVSATFVYDSSFRKRTFL